MSNVRDLVEKVTSPPGLKSPINLPCWSRSRFSLAVRPSTKPDSAKRLTDGSDRFDFLEISGNPTAMGLKYGISRTATARTSPVILTTASWASPSSQAPQFSW
jgi:hypothetical protein